MSTDLEPISPDVEAMLSAERHYEAESDARKLRVMTRLAATAVGVGVGAGAGVAHAAHATWIARLARLARTKAAIAVGALAIGGAGGGAVGHELGVRAAERRIAAAAASVPTIAPVATASSAPGMPVPSASSIDVLALPSSAPANVPAPRPHAPVAQHETGDEDLAAELAYVQMARTALARQNFSAALDATDQHAKKFPNGHLAEERESLAIQALVGAGRDGEARARAARFRAKYPHSLLLPAVEAAVRAP